MESCAVFFDIDGTLWDYKGEILESTRESIRRLKENGHLTFLCTGRTKVTVRNRTLLDMGFDGMIAGCGTYIEYKNDILLNEYLDWKDTGRLISIMRDKGIGAFLEGDKKLYIDWDYYENSDYALGFREELKEDCLSILEADENSTINKISLEYLDLEAKDIINIFDYKFDCIIHDFKNPDGSDLNVAEIVPKSYSKATGIKWICNYLNIDLKNTYAFGDSANDIDMIEVVNCGVAMGNASEALKKKADYITSPMKEDGIYNGLKHLGLI